LQPLQAKRNVSIARDLESFNQGRNAGAVDVGDFGQVENGVKFSDVKPNSPAAKAGLKAGDILVQFGDKPIKNLYDFTDALRRSKVGDVVEVKVMRDGRPLNFVYNVMPR